VIRKELNIINLNNKIQNHRRNCFHRVERMEPERIPKRLIDSTHRGTRSIGRPKDQYFIEEQNGLKDPNLDVNDDDDGGSENYMLLGKPRDRFSHIFRKQRLTFVSDYL
jgi:hypothetical protein